MATIQIALRKNAINLVYQNRKQQYIPLGVSVEEKYFNKPPKGKKMVEGKWIKQSCIDANVINATIADRLSELRTYINRYHLDHKVYPEPKAMKNFFSKAHAQEFTFEKLWGHFTYYQAHKGDDSVSIKRINQYATALRHLQEFNPAIDINQIDVAFYHGYKEFLQRVKHNNINTIGKQINILKAFLHWAIENDKTKLQERTVRKFKVKWDECDIIFHPLPEIQMLFDVDLSHRPMLDRMRDAYLLQCLTGFRHSDSRRETEWSVVGNFLRLRSLKSGTEITLPLRTEVQYLVNKYTNHGLPFPSYENQPYNRGIKEICELAGIKQAYTFVHGRHKHKAGQTVPKHEACSSHTARATFICMMIENNIHTRKIMEMTGIKEEKTINHYAAVLKSSLGEEMQLVETKQALRVSYIRKAI